MKQLQKLSKFLSDYTSIVVIAIAVITFFLPSLMGWVNFQLFTDPVANKFTSQSIIIGVIMFSMGLTLTTEDWCDRSVSDHAIPGICNYKITESARWNRSWTDSCRMLSWRSIIKHYVLSLRWRCCIFCWNDNCIYNPLSSDDTTDGILSGKRSQDHNSWITNVCIYHRNGYRTSSDRVCIKLRIRKK